MKNTKTHLKEETKLEDNNIPMDDMNGEEKTEKPEKVKKEKAPKAPKEPKVPKEPREKKEFPVKTLMIVMIALVVVAAVVLLGIFVIKPKAAIGSATRMAEKGDVAEAYEALDRMSKATDDDDEAKGLKSVLEDAAQRKQEIQQKVFDTRKTAELKFGKYDWIVLEERDGKALVITKDIISQLVYHNVADDITWEECSLRAYLNGAFLNEFSAEEKARIVETQNKNTNNPEYSVKNGKDTKDSIFLLSLEEANLYFKDEASRAAKFQHAYGWWWLRSAGMYENLAAMVTSDGTIAYTGSGVTYANRGVRPAMWIKMP